jgi:hypothetical protein
MDESIVLKTQSKLGVVMLAMHDINKYISSTCCDSTIFSLINIAFVLSSCGHVVNLTTFFVIVAHTYREFACQAEPCANSLPSSKVWTNAIKEI